MEYFGYINKTTVENMIDQLKKEQKESEFNESEELDLNDRPKITQEEQRNWDDIFKYLDDHSFDAMTGNVEVIEERCHQRVETFFAELPLSVKKIENDIPVYKEVSLEEAGLTIQEVKSYLFFLIFLFGRLPTQETMLQLFKNRTDSRNADNDSNIITTNKDKNKDDLGKYFIDVSEFQKRGNKSDLVTYFKVPISKKLVTKDNIIIQYLKSKKVEVNEKKRKYCFSKGHTLLTNEKSRKYCQQDINMILTKMNDKTKFNPNKLTFFKN